MTCGKRKKESLYSSGMKIAMSSQIRNQADGTRWFRGGEAVVYAKSQSDSGFDVSIAWLYVSA